NTQRYVVAEDVALVDGAATVSIFPALVDDYDNAAVVTFEAAASSVADAYHANLMFHRNFAALATSPISNELGSQLASGQGIEVETATDPQHLVILRARRWYDPDNSRTVIAVDMLYGFDTLDVNLACKMRRGV